MVYPVHAIKFKVATDGRTGETLVIIKDLETFEVTIDGQVQEWTPMDQEGWVRRLVTGKSLGISVSGKRHEGDPGNDYVAETSLKTGSDCNSVLEVEFPSGATLKYDCVINTSTFAGGGSTDVSGLAAEFLSDGKPTYTPAT